MKATLIATTQPVVGVPASNGEDLIAFCARVSSGRNYEDRGKDYEGLLRYCVRNKHWSVFDMADAIVEVDAPRDITRQVIRHKSCDFQEFSQRYSDDILYTPRELRYQDKTNRQNSIEPEENDPLKEEFVKDCQQAAQYAKKLYDKWGELGAAKEVMRVFNPEGLTKSILYVKGSARSWIHYLMVRDDPGVTQKEHVELARMIRKAIEPAFPTIIGMIKNEHSQY